MSKALNLLNNIITNSANEFNETVTFNDNVNFMNGMTFVEASEQISANPSSIQDNTSSITVNSSDILTSLTLSRTMNISSRLP